MAAELPKDCSSKRLRIRRRHDNSAVPDDGGAVAHVGNDARQPASHCFADGIRKALAPNRGRAKQVEAVERRHGVARWPGKEHSLRNVRIASKRMELGF